MVSYIVLLTIFAFPLLIEYGAASSILFRGGTIIGWNDEGQSLEVTRNGSLLVADEKIVAVFAQGQEPKHITKDTEVVDATDKIITPGFVDTHRHGWTSAWRTIASNNTMWDYFHHKFPAHVTRAFGPDDIYIGQLASIYEALNAGTTTMLDYAHHTWTKSFGEAGLKASTESGARMFHAYAIGIWGYGTTLEQQAADFRDVYKSFDFQNTLTSLGIGSDAWTSSNVEPMLELIRDLDIPFITTHLVGGPYGINNRPEDLHRLGILNTSIPIIFSHASFLDLYNYQLLRSTNQYISISPETEHSTSQTNPTAHLFLDQASLGIDEFFTSSIDILTQARIFLQHVRQLLYTHVHSLWKVPRNNPMSVNQAFLLATRNGGLALRRPDIGVITPGAKADIVVWDGTSPGLLGWLDPVAAVIQHASVADIEHVLVNGVFKKRNGKLVVQDYGNIKKRFLESARRIQAATLAAPRVEPKSDEKWMTGAEVVEIPEVDVVRGEGTGYGPLWHSLERTRGQQSNHDEL